MNTVQFDKTGVTVVALVVSIVVSAARFSPAAAAADTAAIADPEVRACVDRALPRHTMTQKLTLQVVDASETMRESSGILHWKRFDDGLARALFRIEDSPQYQGVGILMRERSTGEPDVYMYSPELRRDRRITSAALAGPLLGTDFSYEDFALLQHLTVTGEIKRLDDAEVDGHPAFVVETTPDIEKSSYSRVLTFIDKEWCLPVVTRFFAHNGSLYKELLIERAAVRLNGEHWTPHRSTMHNHKHDSRTVLAVTSIEIDIDLPDDLFTPTELRKGH